MNYSICAELMTSACLSHFSTLVLLGHFNKHELVTIYFFLVPHSSGVFNHKHKSECQIIVQLCIPCWLLRKEMTTSIIVV